MKDFFNKNKKAIITIAVLVVVAAVGIGGYFGVIKPKIDNDKAVIAQEEADKKALKEKEKAERLAQEEAEEKVKAEEREKKRQIEIAKIAEEKKQAEADKIKAESEAAAKEADDKKNAASKPNTSSTDSKGDISKPSGDTSSKPAVPSKPVEKPKPEPPKALPEEDRTPATTQENQVIDTSLTSGGHNHGDTMESEYGDGTLYWHVGAGWIFEKDWIQGRWASHPEGTQEMFLEWTDKQISPFQEHKDIIMDGGEEYFFCSFDGAVTQNPKGYAGHQVSDRHINGVKNNYHFPVVI